MACSVCAGHSDKNCPCCSPQYIECPECEGSGYTYFMFDRMRRMHKPCTEAAYKILPFDEDEAKELNARYCMGNVEICECCKGDGIIADV